MTRFLEDVNLQGHHKTETPPGIGKALLSLSQATCLPTLLLFLAGPCPSPESAFILATSSPLLAGWLPDFLCQTNLSSPGHLPCSGESEAWLFSAKAAGAGSILEKSQNQSWECVKPEFHRNSLFYPGLWSITRRGREILSHLLQTKPGFFR